MPMYFQCCYLIFIIKITCTKSLHPNISDIFIFFWWLLDFAIHMGWGFVFKYFWLYNTKSNIIMKIKVWQCLKKLCIIMFLLLDSSVAPNSFTLFLSGQSSCLKLERYFEILIFHVSDLLSKYREVGPFSHLEMAQGSAKNTGIYND